MSHYKTLDVQSNSTGEDIKKAYKTSLGLTYDVQFEKDSTIKSLVAKYAKLQLY